MQQRLCLPLRPCGSARQQRLHSAQGAAALPTCSSSPVAQRLMQQPLPRWGGLGSLLVPPGCQACSPQELCHTARLQVVVVLLVLVSPRRLLLEVATP